MDFAFTEEQEQLRAAARDFLADRYPIDRVISLIDDPERGFDATRWRELADLGWLDPELTVLDLAVLAEESGAALLPLPWWSAMALAAPLLDEELRAAVAAGERAVTVADVGPHLSISNGNLTATVALVPDLAVVTDVIVVSGDRAWTVDLTEQPQTVVRRATIDRSRPLGDLRLDATPARPLPLPSQDHRRPPALEHRQPARLPGVDRALALAACEAVGVGQRVLDLAAAYAKERQQFGRVIGTYQGVSHRVANTYVAVQLARSMAYWAAWAVSESDEAAALAVAGANSSAGEGAVFACEQAIQVHGGIGFTWEHPLHRYYKRAQWIDSFGGSGRQHRAAIAAPILAS